MPDGGPAAGAVRAVLHPAVRATTGREADGFDPKTEHVIHPVSYFG